MVRQAHDSAGGGKWHYFAVYCRVHLISFIPALRRPRCPDAIIGRIWAVVILSFYLSLWRASPHVSEKLLETIEPRVTDRNSSAAIIRECLGLWVVAPGLHGAPNLIFSGDQPLSCVAVSSVGFGYAFALEAAATECFTAMQTVHAWRLFIAALTTANPPTVFFIASGKSDNSQTSKHRISQIKHL